MKRFTLVLAKIDEREITLPPGTSRCFRAKDSQEAARRAARLIFNDYYGDDEGDHIITLVVAQAANQCSVNLLEAETFHATVKAPRKSYSYNYDDRNADADETQPLLGDPTMKS